MDVFFEEAGREGGRQNWQDRNLKKKTTKWVELAYKEEHDGARAF